MAAWMTEVLVARSTAIRTAGAANHLMDVVYGGEPSDELRPRRLAMYLRHLSLGTAPDRDEIIFRAGTEFLGRYPFDEYAAEVTVLLGRAVLRSGTRDDQVGALRLLIRAQRLFPDDPFGIEVARTAFQLATVVGESIEPIEPISSGETESRRAPEERFYNHIVRLQERRSAAETRQGEELWQSYVILESEEFIRLFPKSEYRSEIYQIMGSAYEGTPARAARWAGAVVP